MRGMKRGMKKSGAKKPAAAQNMNKAKRVTGVAKKGKK